MSEIDWTKPNREADAWIAEHVFDYHWDWCWTPERLNQASLELAQKLWYRHLRPPRMSKKEGEPPEGAHIDTEYYYDGPRYTDVIDSAWEIVEEAGYQGYWCQLRTPFGADGECNDGYWCGFTPHLTSGWNGTPDHWVSAATLPLAICHSAYLLWEGTQGAPE